MHTEDKIDGTTNIILLKNYGNKYFGPFQINKVYKA